MVTTIAESELRHSFKPSIFFWITVAMACFVFGGFGLTYWQPMLSGTGAPFPPIVHIHAFVFSSWMILLMVQSALINTKNVALHRSIGTFGIAIATSMLITSAEVTVLFIVGATVLTLIFIGIHNAWDAVAYIAVQQRSKPRE